MYGEQGGPIFCSNCNGVIICDFGDMRDPASIVMTNSYACWEHIEQAKAKAYTEPPKE